MTTWFKRIGLALLALIILLAAAAWLAVTLGERKLQRKIDVQLSAVTLHSDAAAVARGHYLFISRGCSDCHGMDGAGTDVVNNGKDMLIHSANITTGPGGVGSAYTALDWTRTLRHGVKPDGRPMMLMPSEEYARLTDIDIAALVAYVGTLAPASGGPSRIALPLPMLAMYGLGLIPDAAEKIDHHRPPTQPVPEGVTDAHGGYVANSCIGCHGDRLAGGRIKGAPPDWPPAANLTPGEGSVLTRYPTPESFVAMLRTGKRPDGSEVSKVMPFESLREMNDTDANALYLHLKALAPLPTGQR